MMRATSLGLALLGLAVAVPACGPPVSKKFPVTDTYHGVSVVDEYQWLEDWEAPEVRKWSEAQNRHARDYLERLPHLQPWLLQN